MIRSYLTASKTGHDWTSSKVTDEEKADWEAYADTKTSINLSKNHNPPAVYSAPADRYLKDMYEKMRSLVVIASNTDEKNARNAQNAEISRIKSVLESGGTISRNEFEGFFISIFHSRLTKAKLSEQGKAIYYGINDLKYPYESFTQSELGEQLTRMEDSLEVDESWQDWVDGVDGIEKDEANAAAKATYKEIRKAFGIPASDEVIVKVTLTAEPNESYVLNKKQKSIAQGLVIVKNTPGWKMDARATFIAGLEGEQKEKYDRVKESKAASTQIILDSVSTPSESITLQLEEEKTGLQEQLIEDKPWLNPEVAKYGK